MKITIKLNINMDKKITELAAATSIQSSDVSVLVHNGADLQYSFATLLTFLSSNLGLGAAISFGTTLPTNISGKNGDIFFNTATAAIAQKTLGVWTIVYNLPTAGLTDSTVLYGIGVPASGTGSNGDTYINTATGMFYKKASDAWSNVFSILNGPAGARGEKGDKGDTGAAGRTILSGTTNPSNLTDGINGDYYINTSNFTLFGPKTAGVWGIGTNVIGPAGAKGDTGNTGPQGAAGPTGAKGDTGDTGPQGPQGEDGDTGPQGPTGDTGATGPQGIKGDTGDQGPAGPKGDTGDTGPQGPQGAKGDTGDAGPAGANGATGAGVATGGSTGQVLAKINGTNYNTQWIDPPAGVTKATLAEVNAGADDAKFATALALEGSKYADQSGAKLSATASGTNAYTATISPAITAYSNTQRFYIRFTNGNTNVGCTLALNGLAALPLVKGINTAISVGDIVANSIHVIAIDGTNARILSLSAIPTVTTGEKVLTITSSGPQKTYDLQEMSVSPTSLTAADFSTGMAVVTGLPGQVAYDSNYRYDSVGINQWRRSALNGSLVDLYLADIDDSAGDKTSAQLQTAYPASVIGQQVWGLNNLYIKKTLTLWKKVAAITA
ncbi:hypothetical protein GCM10028827_40990 [Mucilaginibacter myungsuensis]